MQMVEEELKSVKRVIGATDYQNEKLTTSSDNHGGSASDLISRRMQRVRSNIENHPL